MHHDHSKMGSTYRYEDGLETKRHDPRQTGALVGDGCVYLQGLAQ